MIAGGIALRSHRSATDSALANRFAAGTRKLHLLGPFKFKHTLPVLGTFLRELIEQHPTPTCTTRRPFGRTPGGDHQPGSSRAHRFPGKARRTA